MTFIRAYDTQMHRIVGRSVLYRNLRRYPRMYLSSTSDTRSATNNNAYGNAARANTSDRTTGEDECKKDSGVTFKTISELSKLRLSALVVATSSAGFLAAGGPISWSTLTACSLGTALCASSAATFNQIFEVDRDKAMKRTRNRPLPSQIVSEEFAYALGLATGTAGTAALALGTDAVTATLGFGNIALYSGLYTYMKPRSELNTWVGAIVGAIPPVMGWTAAGGSVFDPEAILLGSTLFLWQFPHFFALSWMHRVDYARGGFQMVPCNDQTGDRTARLIKQYTWYLASIPFISTALEVTNSMFAIESIVMNGYALYVAKKFDKDRSNGNARKVFLTSLWYLPCLMTLFILHSKTWKEDNIDVKDGDLRIYLKDSINKIRNKGRELCLHEAQIEKKKEASCPIPIHRKSSANISIESIQNSIPRTENNNRAN